MNGSWLLEPWRAPLEAAYVLTVASIAAYGFTAGSTAAILLAGLLALPTSIPAIVGFYVVYGLLAQVSGANPDSSSGSGSCSSGGVCRGSVTGDPATWFVFVTNTTGILALTAAAVANVALLRLVSRPRRASSR